MPPAYNINISNNSGSSASYVLFAEKPQVLGQVAPQIWSVVTATAQSPPGSQAHFSIDRRCFAITGTSRGSPSPGVAVRTTAKNEVALAQQLPDGSVQPGTALNFVGNAGRPEFSRDESPSTGIAGAFEIRTSSDFNPAQAKRDNWLVGVGGSQWGEYSGPTAVWTPQPHVSYQIKPKNVYYLAIGDFRSDQIIDPEQLWNKVKLDFNNSPSQAITHNPDGTLRIR